MEKASSLAWLEELKFPEMIRSETVKSLHATIDQKWDPIHRTACQTAAGRALWNHVIHDPVAGVLAGESFLRSLYEKMKNDLINNAREVSGVILAVRTLWFDSKLENAIYSLDDGDAQVVRLNCLKNCTVFEVDFPELLEAKAKLIKEAMGASGQKSMKAKSLVRVAAHAEAMQVLETISAHCRQTKTILLADFMNKASVSLSQSTFQFYSDWPDRLLPTVGLRDVKVSQIGDPDARFGLLHDALNLFDKLRNVPRSVHFHPEDGTPCRRLYLVEASGGPVQFSLQFQDRRLDLRLSHHECRRLNFYRLLEKLLFFFFTVLTVLTSGAGSELFLNGLLHAHIRWKRKLLNFLMFSTLKIKFKMPYLLVFSLLVPYLERTELTASQKQEDFSSESLAFHLHGNEDTDVEVQSEHYHQQ